MGVGLVRGGSPPNPSTSMLRGRSKYIPDAKINADSQVASDVSPKQVIAPQFDSYYLATAFSYDRKVYRAYRRDTVESTVPYVLELSKRAKK